MKSIIKNNITSFVYDKRKALVFIVFAWFCGTELVVAESLNMSVFEYLLYVMGNHYYIIYFLFMAYLFFQFDTIKRENNCITIRIKTLKRKFMSQLVSVFFQTFIYVIVHVIVAFVIGGTKLEFTNKFQTRVVDGYYSDTLSFLYEYSDFFSNPIIAVIMTVMYLTMGLTVMGVLIYTAKEIVGPRATLIFLGLIILDIMFGFKVGIKGMAEILYFNNYFILHHVLFANGREFVCVNMIIDVLIVAGAYLFLKRKKANKGQLYNFVGHMFTNIYKISGVFIGVYVGLNVFSFTCVEKDIGLLDGVIGNLIGYSITNFNLMEFIRHILLYAIPLFLIGSILQKEKQMYHDQVAIRYKNKNVWKKLLHENISMYIIIYILSFELLLGFLAILDTLLQNTNYVYISEFLLYTGIGKQELIQIVIISCVFKFLELTYYKEILIFISDMTGNSILAYVITVLGFSVSLVPNNIITSYGKSSLYFLAEKVSYMELWKVALELIGVIVIKITLVKITYYVWRNKNENGNRSYRRK